MILPIKNPLREGLRQERVIPPQCLVIFGASGDLTQRKLIPAKLIREIQAEGTCTYMILTESP